ncbi:hypothetical protein Gotur_004710, partial [Gossypium turneri]
DLQNLPRLLPQWPFTLPLRIRRFLLKTGFQTLWFLQHLGLQTGEPSRRNRLSSARRQELRELQFFLNNCEDFAVHCKTGMAMSNQTAGLFGFNLVGAVGYHATKGIYEALTN